MTNSVGLIKPAGKPAGQFQDGLASDDRSLKGSVGSVSSPEPLGGP
jgi:hypothetical protein